MNRREFLFRASAATAALVAAPAIALTPTPPPIPADPFEIMSPDEIKAWLGNDRYVPTPCFQIWRVEDGKLDYTPYAVKTRRLTTVVDVDLLSKPRHTWIHKVHAYVKPQIERIGFTHLHSVRLSDIPTSFHPNGEHPHYWAYVRGATVRNLSSVVHGKISLTLSDL